MILGVLSLPLNAQTHSHGKSHGAEYAGQQTRSVKSLSAEDIQALEQGSGWGLAKSAELNGLPGPLHLLESKDELALSNEQQRAIEQIFKRMNSKAIRLGQTLIAQERKLDTLFQQPRPNAEAIEHQVLSIGRTRASLRYVHLSAHLETPAILTAQQIASYNALRGYTDDPCATVPQGHDPNMWKKHNNCK